MITEANYRKYNQVKFYFGIVNEVLEDYSIRFRIPNIIDNLNDDEYPIAHPILKHTSEIFKSDTVLIMQLDVDMQDFVYFSNDVTQFTGLRFGHDIIDLSLGQEDSPSLSIKVVSLSDDNGNIEEGEKMIPTSPYTEINLSDEKITITKSTPKESDTSQKDGDNVVVTIDDNGIDAVVNEVNSGSTTQKSQVTVSKDGEITLNTTPGQTSETNTVFGDNKIELIAGKTTKSTATLDGQNSKMELVAGADGATSSTTIDGTKGVNAKSILESEMDLGALVDLHNTVGSLGGAIDDLWTEMRTLTQNILTWAGMVANIQFVGPGATINASAGGIPAIAASMATMITKQTFAASVFKQ